MQLLERSLRRVLKCAAVGLVASTAVAWSLLPVMAQSTTPATQPAVVNRPRLSEQQYKQVADELRQQYTQPIDQWPAATVLEGAKFAELGLLPEITFPADNPFTREKADLGRVLFFDPRLSSSRQIACVSCNDPDLGWADGRTVAFGHDRQAGKRNTPSIMNSGYFQPLFWDGRADTLEDQAKQPIVNEIEMHATHEMAVANIAAVEGYKPLFKAAFGDDAVDIDRIAKAIATFQRTIKGGRSRFDSFLQGKSDALSDGAVRGLHLYRTAAHCINCHNGPAFTDNQFHNVGLTYYGRPFEDLGRWNITKKPEDVGAFKTPSLRNITRTGPFMHNGLFELDGVINLYNAGMPNERPKEGHPAPPPQKSKLLTPLGLNEQDRHDLIEFLQHLEEPRLRVRAPELPK
jgi:cytochrome c peroxidase